jgi:hypothetical protein
LLFLSPNIFFLVCCLVPKFLCRPGPHWFHVPSGGTKKSVLKATRWIWCLWNSTDCNSFPKI